jgi:hypothetical protein
VNVANDVSCYEAAYEVLREQILGGIAISSGRQLTLILHEGMGAWLRVAASLFATREVNHESTTAVSPSACSQLQPQYRSPNSMTGLMPLRYYAAATSLLAGMALAARKDLLR